MKNHQCSESFAEEIFHALRRITPEVSLGFPSDDEIQRRRAERLESKHQRLLFRQDAEEREFQRLKTVALEQIRKNRP